MKQNKNTNTFFYVFLCFMKVVKSICLYNIMSKLSYSLLSNATNAVNAINAINAIS